MLIYSENRYISTETNMMIIRAKDDIGYYYVHRGLYDQAVILSDIYKENYELLCEVISGRQDVRSDVRLFVDSLPTPINILGCFLLLVEEPLVELLDMGGAIHVMSNSINFRKLITLPAEVRANVMFSLSIKEEYELPWDRFIKESILWTEDFYVRRNDVPMNGTYTNTSDTTQDDYDAACVGDDGVEYSDPLEALLMGASDDIFDMPPDMLEEEEGDDEEEVIPDPVVPAHAVNTSSVMQVASATVIETNPDLEQAAQDFDQPVVKTGLDFLRGLGK